MPLILTNFADGVLCHGCSWRVHDTSALAERIARVAIGQSQHVARILAGVNVGPPVTSAGAKATAIKMLTVVAGADPWHRDGWIFQTMSWLTAHLASPNAIIRSPHMILAHKGFDGLQLEIDASGLVSAAIIFEDKATDHARKTITAEVWPEFRRMEAGDRENFLTAEVSALLQTNPALDADKAIENIIWKQVRRYRVSLTVSAKDATPTGRQKLFKGFDSVAAGSVDRRRAEIFEIDQLRKWMAALADQTIACIKATATQNV